MIQLIALTYSKVSIFQQGCEMEYKFYMNFSFIFSLITEMFSFISALNLQADRGLIYLF